MPAAGLFATIFFAKNTGAKKDFRCYPSRMVQLFMLRNIFGTQLLDKGRCVHDTKIMGARSFKNDLDLAAYQQQRSS